MSKLCIHYVYGQQTSHDPPMAKNEVDSDEDSDDGDPDVRH